MFSVRSFIIYSYLSPIGNGSKDDDDDDGDDIADICIFILKVTVCTCRSLSCVSLCSSLSCFPRFYSNMSSLMRVKGISLCENPSCSALQV